ncbi:hypothetical protein [Streptomyces violaceusniger]|uniref:Uncharacterized protein n=1 Tax=Streptomyces violaceusniger (strain Tu 4113) TaxID=653045 RepID=G2PHM4_STRV4|nr:hypothetical protein [Streptomyces violaceusniger]AEM88825.1 hypothetical protein Strvi_0048 [Streptomyces violaceusniger Tu 4113]
MRTPIVRWIRRRRPAPTGGTRIYLPDTSVSAACRYYGYPDAPGADWPELSTHFKIRRAIGEPV